jgi:hypothetical protein
VSGLWVFEVFVMMGSPARRADSCIGDAANLCRLTLSSHRVGKVKRGNERMILSGSVRRV